MSISLVITVVKNFWPSTWFGNIAEEAEAVPATIAGIFFVWVTIIGLAVFALTTYNADAQANEIRLTGLETTLAANTTALNCSRQDRVIAHMLREIEQVKQLIEQATQAAEKRRLQSTLTTLELEFDRAETAYKGACL